MPTDNSIYDALRTFATEVTAKSSSVVTGEPEDQLRAPFETLLQAAGTILETEVVCVGETLLKHRIGKPDYGINTRGLLAGHAELKAPGKGVTRRQFTGHDLEQFDRFAQLSNVLYTDGNEWALYRYGKRDRAVVRLSGNVAQDGHEAVSKRNAHALWPLLTDFLTWEPVIPTNQQGHLDLKEFASQLAALCRFLRDDVKESLNDSTSPLNRTAEGWRELLFPNAPDEQFADAYAQTVVFALLLARGAMSNQDEGLTLATAQSALQTHHNLLSAALVALTDQQAYAEIGGAVASVLRLVNAVPVAALETDPDLWLYFYEDFLAQYDPDLRKDAGVYYTPIEVVRAQVRLIDDLLVNRLGKADGFASLDVVTLDPATGTGTYLLNVIDHTLQRVSKDQGTGAVAGQATRLAQNTFGFEIMVGPYAVADLRVSGALRAREANLPPNGAQIYLTDTLESPNIQPMQGYFGPAQALSQEHERALRVKKDRKVLVCLGNPPYDRTPATNESGGWVRHGDEGDEGSGNQPIFDDFINPAIVSGYGRQVHNIYNLYVYFWRWALWKVFEQNDQEGPGVVSFISASSYFDGDAFAGMREHMRRVCDDIWIIDLGGERRGPRKSENVFNIQTPVAIAIAVRFGTADVNLPAKIHYRRLEGTRAEKLRALDKIAKFGEEGWQDCPSDFQAPFRPVGNGTYFDWPLIKDLMPWQQSGVKAGRTWVIAPLAVTLRDRWDLLIQADKDKRKTLFKDSPTGRKVHEPANQLPPSDVRLLPILDLPKGSQAPVADRFAYRAFDRQFVFSDARLLDRPSPTLWRTHSERQIYLTSIFSQPLGAGPALIASALIPDLHSFRGSFGAKSVIPLYRDVQASEPNLLPNLLEHLSKVTDLEIAPEGFVAYVYGIMSVPAYVELFYQELDTRQVRIPITADADLFHKIRDLGAKLIWLHTYGERFVPNGYNKSQVPLGVAQCTVGVQTCTDDYPNSFRYDYDTQTLFVGDGEFAPVQPAIYEYGVSGLKVVQSWLKYRMLNGAGLKSSPLDDIRPAVWPAEFTTELLQLIWVLEATLDIHAELTILLDAVVKGDCIAEKDLTTAIPDSLRKPPSAPPGGARLV